MSTWFKNKNDSAACGQINNGFLPEKGSSVRSTYDLLKKSKVVLCKKYVWFNEELESGPL